jgi:hypothetical protein
MIPACECRLVEHKLRVDRVDRLAPHLAEVELQQRRRGRGAALGRLRRTFGAALVAAGTRLQGAPRVVPSGSGRADLLGAGR